MKQRKLRLRAKNISFGWSVWGGKRHAKCTYGWEDFGEIEPGKRLYRETCWRRK